MPLAILFALLFQFPASKTLSPEEHKTFDAEVRRIQQLLKTANDPGAVTYALARTYAAAGQYLEAADWLNRMAVQNLGLDPSHDDKFEKLLGTPEFASIVDKVHAATPPVLRSHIAFAIDEDNLAPEGIAYSAKAKLFFVGSTSKHKIVACSAGGGCRDFVNDPSLGGVLGIKISPLDGSLWTAANQPKQPGLFHYSSTGKLIRKYTSAAAQLFNDLAIDPAGNVFVTDTQANTVFWVSRAADRLEVLAPSLHVNSANGIAVSDDGRKLYVAGFGDGLTLVDLPARTSRPLPHPPELCLANIDGLVFFKGSLIAIQNGIMTHRVIRFDLTPDLNRIGHFEVLERRNPLFEGITTGTIADGSFYFMANVDSRNRATTILKLDLTRILKQ